MAWKKGIFRGGYLGGYLLDRGFFAQCQNNEIAMAHF